MSDIVIRPYRPEDESEWMKVHAQLLMISHAWNYAIQERPRYDGYQSTLLVAECDGRIVGLTDVQYENEPGELCLLDDSRGGYVLEFGRLPEFSGHNLGQRLIESTAEDARRQGFNRLEYWTQDRKAQRFYARLGMTVIGRHYRFRMKAPQSVETDLGSAGIGIEYIYGVCSTEDWPRIRREYDIITRPPLEPHLCIGYEIRF